MLSDVVERFELTGREVDLVKDIYLRPASSREYERLIARKRLFEDFQLMAKRGNIPLSHYPPTLFSWFAYANTTLTFRAEDYEKRRHPTPDMATIIAATSTAGRRGLKGTSAGAKKVKENLEKVSKEAASQEVAPPPVDKGKKVVEEEPKKRFRIPRPDGTGGSADVPPPQSEVPVGEKILGASISAAPVGQKRPAGPSKPIPTKKPRTASAASAPGSVRTRLLPTQREDELAPEILSMLPADVQTATSNFYKYWTERWQNFMEEAGATDVLTVLVGQAARAFGAAIEVQTLFKNLQGKSNDTSEKVEKAEEEANRAKAEVEEVRKEAKRAKAEVEEVKRLHSDEAAKLSSALTEIENLRKEVHTCQGEVASMTRKVDNSDALQRIASEALEKANRESATLKADLEKAKLASNALSVQVSSLTEEVEDARKEAEVVGSEAEKRFISNFHLTEMYKNFAIYWRGYAYREMIEWMEAKHPGFDTSEMRQEFLEEEADPQTPAEEVPLLIIWRTIVLKSTMSCL